MRPALKSFVYFDRHPDGVFFRSGGTAFVLKGGGIYPIVSRLLGLLDGTREKDAIAAALPEKVRPLLDVLLGELGRRGFLVDRGTPGALAAELQSDFATALAYLSDHGPDALPRFEAWHRRTLAVAGSGRVFVALVEALADLGAGNLILLEDSVSESGSALDRIRAAAAARASGQKLVTVGGADELAGIGADALLYAADQLDEARIAAVAAQVAPALLAGGLDGRVIIAPGAHRIGFADLRSRLHPPEEQGDLPASAAQLTLAGSLLGFEWFRIDTGLAGRSFDDRGKTVSPDLTVQDFPLDPVRFAEQEPPAEHPERELSEFETLSQRLKPLFDETTGIFSSSSGGEINQLPLYHHEIAVRPSPAAGGAPVPVQAWGLGVEDAGLRAIRRAAERHVADRLGAAGDGILLRAAFSADEALARIDLMSAYLDEGARAAAARIPVAYAEAASETLVLWRLIEALGGGPIEVERFAWSGRAGAVVAVAAGGETVAWAAEANAEDGLREALGSYCSRLQLGDRAELQPTPAPGAYGEAWIDQDGPLAGFGIFVAQAKRIAA